MKKFKQLLINSIDEEITGSTVEKLTAAKAIFESEMLWEQKSLNEYQLKKRLQDWLQGLCSTISLPFQSHDIIAWYESELGRKTTEPKSNKGTSEAEKWLENYWPQCGRSLYELFYQ